jgi:hypothetical protein
MADLAARVERQSDHERSHILLRDDLAKRLEIRGDPAPPHRPQRPRETERLFADGETDRAISDVEGKIPHAQGAAAAGASLWIAMRAPRTGSRGHQPGQVEMRTSRSPRSVTMRLTSS